MSNKRVLSEIDLGKYKKPNPYKNDITYDPMGQWKYPGQNTRIPSNDITMEGVNYPVWAQPNVGPGTMMQPGGEYNFPGADYVDEFPQMQEGGLISYDDINNSNMAMMKAKLAYAQMHGNPAAQRMINIPDNPYIFDNGDMGTHYMASMDNYAVPQIQDENGELVLGDYGPESNEAMRFDTPEDAEYFAENYKSVSPGFIEAELTDDEIEEYRKGGYVVEDISTPSLTQAQIGKQVKKSPYQLQEEARKKAGQSKYDMLETNKPQVSENTKPKNAPVVDKNITTKALNQKNLERQAIAEEVKNQPLLSEEQKTEILLDPRKLDENAYLINQQDPGTVQTKVEQTWQNRLKDIALNPDAAIYYGMSGKDMPGNYQAMLDAGIDPMANEAGGNSVLKGLNSLNPLVTMRDINKATGQGNYTEAGLGLLGFIPGGKQFKAAKNLISDETLKAYNLAVDLQKQGKLSNIPKTPEGFDTWLQSQYNKKPLYRVVDVNKDVVNNPLVKKNMLKQGLDPNNEYHVAEYMGTSIAPAEVINRGRRSGGHDELLKGTDKDLLYFAEDPSWIGDRYGGANPYYVKTFADELPSSLKNQVLGLRPTSSMQKNYTRNYPGFDINKVPSGSLFEDQMLSVGDNRITPIIGNKGEKVRRVNQIVKGSDFERLPNKKFNEGGYIETELSEEEIEQYRKGGYIVENID